MSSSTTSTLMCLNCGTLQTEALLLLCCAACKSTKYCGAPCQKAHWPMHMDICKQLVKQAGRQKQALEEMPAGERSLYAMEKQWKNWSKGCSMTLTYLTHQVLDGRQATHVAVIQVDLCLDQPPRPRPVFTVTSARAMTDADWARQAGSEGLLDRIKANRKTMVPPAGLGLVLGLAFFDDGLGKRPCSSIYGMLSEELVKLATITTVASWISDVNDDLMQLEI